MTNSQNYVIVKFNTHPSPWIDGEGKFHSRDIEKEFEDLLNNCSNVISIIENPNNQNELWIICKV